MDFIVENYVWFIVGGVIIIMAIIGYYADKTDFGRVKKESKPKKEVKEVVEVSEPKPKKEKKKKAKDKEKTEESVVEANVEPTLENVNNEDLFQTLEPNTNVESNEMVDESLFAPLTEADPFAIPQEFTTEQPVEIPSANVTDFMNTEVDNELELNNVEPVALPEEQPVDYNTVVEGQSPELNVVTEQPVAEDDDVWKF